MGSKEMTNANQLAFSLAQYAALHIDNRTPSRPFLNECAETLKTQAAQITQLQAEVEALRKDAAWIPVSERLPDGGVTVLACYKNSIGNVRRIRAMWIPAKSSEASSESDFGEYDEASDTYYDPEGWYEKIDNAADYSAMFVSEVVTHWMHLPKPPTATAKDTQE
jgi:hypothetical protein